MASAQTYLFNKADFGTGTNPVSVVTGDFNGDGITDLAVANQACPVNVCEVGSVSILLGKPDGTFQPHADYPTGASFAHALAVGDFNGDGKPDLVVAGQEVLDTCGSPPRVCVGGGGGVAVLLSNGDGTFQPAVFYNITGSGGITTSIAVGDFNRDGKFDLAVTDGVGSVSILLGKGDGTFEAAVDYPAGFVTSSVATGDFNGDGKLDLAVVNRQDNSVSILLGNGDGTFKPQVEYPTGTFPQSIAIGDFNADGKLDLAITNNEFGNGNTVSVLLGNGDGTFRTHLDYPSGPAFGIIAGDFAGNGKLDLAVTGGAFSFGVSVLLGNGDGTFQTPKEFASGYGTTAAATADFNGDGKPDLVVVNLQDNTASVLLGNGDGSFVTSHAYPAAGPLNSFVADLTNDGKLDLVPSNGVLLGKGDGTFQPLIESSTNLWPATAGDFNHDGKLDLAVFTSGSIFPLGEVAILLGNGDGTFRSPVNYPVSYLGLALASGDFRGDGILDIATAGYEGSEVSVLLGNGDGTFRPETVYPVTGPGGTNPELNSIAVSDVNGDGKLDIVVASQIGISVLLGNGGGTFKPHVDYPLQNGGGYGLAIADFNQDGRPDVVTLVGGAMAIFIGNRNGTFQTPVMYATPNPNGPLIVGDFNRDGKLDVAMLGQDGSPAILFGNGDGTFRTPAVSYAAGLGGNSLAVGEFGENGTLALAVPNVLGPSPAISVFLDSPIVAVSPTKLSFGSPSVGVSSPKQIVTLSNPGTAPLKISGISGIGDFGQTNNCPKSLASGENCQIRVTFTPSVAGARTGAITITDSAPGRTQIVRLRGGEPAVKLSTTGLLFPNQTVGTTSGPMSFRVSNEGSGPLAITKITASGDFSETNNCRSTLAIGADCIISVRFKPTKTGTLTGSITITDDDAPSPQVVTLTGTGAYPVPAVDSLSPSRAAAGGAGFTLIVKGSDFVSTSVVRWNGSHRTTTFVSSTELKASILASDIAKAGIAKVTVFNSTPGGGTSNGLTFTMSASPARPQGKH